MTVDDIVTPITFRSGILYEAIDTNSWGSEGERTKRINREQDNGFTEFWYNYGTRTIYRIFNIFGKPKSDFFLTRIGLVSTKNRLVTDMKSLPDGLGDVRLSPYEIIRRYPNIFHVEITRNVHDMGIHFQIDDLIKIACGQMETSHD